MAEQKLVILFFQVILCMHCVNVSAFNTLSQGYLSGTVACKTYNTSKMDCSHRNLIDIPVLNRNLTTMLDLSHNQLKEIHGAPFENLAVLLHLDLSNNIISLLNSTAFKGLGSLRKLDLSYNYLLALPRNIFSDQFKLVYLDLRVNPLYDIPSQTLATLYSLQYPSLTYVGNAFDILMRDLNSLTKLEYLTIDGVYANVTNVTFHPLAGLPIQRLILLWLPSPAKYWIKNTAFHSFTSVRILITDFIALPALGSLHSPLQDLSLRSYSEKIPYILHNTTLQVLSNFKELLTHLDLLLPNLYQIDNDAFRWIPNLSILRIRDSNLQTIAQYSFSGLTALQALVLSDNQLTVVPSKALNVFRIFMSLWYLDLSLNSLSTIEDDDFSVASSLTYLNLGNNKYKDSDSVNLVYTRWLHLLPNITQLVLGANRMSKSLTFIGLPMPLLSLQTFEIRNIQRVIFETNFCLTFPNSRSLVISNAPITNFPFSLSLNECNSLKELDISGSIEDIDLLDLKNTSISIPTLEDLASARNKLKSVAQILFIKAPNLTLLNLTDNQITTIDSSIANAFTRLIYLSIDGNALTSLSGLEDLTHLEHLSAARNLITQVPLWLISKSPTLITLDLSVNPFHCSCELENFRKWIESDTNTWLQSGQYRCSTPETLAGVSISDVELDCRSYTAFYIGISFPFGILFCMIIIFLIRYRWHIKYKLFLLYRNYHPFPNNNEEFEMLQLQYHAYVSYNETSEDNNWVLNDLQPNMEDSPEPVKLCIKSRDFVPGHSLIESISENIHQSRKTILVLSPNFVESNWCHHEMEMAKMMLLDENLDVIILVLLHNIPDNMMTLSLRQLLCRKEYLKWPKDRAGQRLFWQSLRQELKSPIRVDRRFCT